MKAFLDYISEITLKEPVRLIKLDFGIQIYIGNLYINSVTRYMNYSIYGGKNIGDKLIGNTYSFFFGSCFSSKFLRYRFI